jgi:Holliday junction resolvase RusA-like endonuclease
VTGFAFYALGEPGPQGSKTRTRYGMKESSAKVKPWRESIVAAAPTIDRRLDGPLAVQRVFTLPRPKAAPKRLTRPATTPDLDKLARSTCDALKTAGLIADDSRISEFVRLAKVWAGYDPDALPVPGVIVACCEVSGEEFEYAAYLGGLVYGTRCAAWERIRGAA